MHPLAFLANERDLELIGLALGVVFWLRMIRHCATQEPASTEKFFWLAVVIILPGVGSLLYYFLRVARSRA